MKGQARGVSPEVQLIPRSPATEATEDLAAHVDGEASSLGENRQRMANTRELAVRSGEIVSASDSPDRSLDIPVAALELLGQEDKPRLPDVFSSLLGPPWYCLTSSLRQGPDSG